MATRTIVVSDYSGVELAQDAESVKVKLSVKVGTKAAEEFTLDFADYEVTEFIDSIKASKIKGSSSSSVGEASPAKSAVLEKFSHKDVAEWANAKGLKTKAGKIIALGATRLDDDVFVQFAEEKDVNYPGRNAA